MSEPLSLLPEGSFRPRIRRRVRRIHRSALWRRLFHWRQLDFEFASWQMLYLLVSPRRVYRNIYYHKQTKNQWARDDPAFLILQLAALLPTIIAYSVVYDVGLNGFMKALLQLVVVNFILAGVLVATFTWFVANRFLRHRSVHAADQRVEWLYAFDVHCNSFFTFFVFSYVLQLFFVPVLMKTSWISLFLGNTLFALAASAYAFITYLGFHAMPFLQHQEVYLYTIPLVAVVYLASLFGFNISHHVTDYYF
ncbi:UNC-50 [Martensiomyces pterosporus]|nr:UNC-50 [Martensiomyces pterosporus]